MGYQVEPVRRRGHDDHNVRLWLLLRDQLHHDAGHAHAPVARIEHLRSGADAAANLGKSETAVSVTLADSLLALEDQRLVALAEHPLHVAAHRQLACVCG